MRRAAVLVRRHPAAAFIALTFGWSWGWWLPLVFLGRTVEQRRAWPSQFPGLVGPLVAALVVTAIADGRPGLRAYAARLRSWRLPRHGWLIALGTPLAFFATGAVVSGGVSLGSLDDMSGVPEVGVGGLWLVAVFFNGLGEEGGWRGFLFPLMRERRPLVPAAARVTAVWAVWHLPLFWLLASYQGFSLFMGAGFVIGLGAGSLVLAHVYETTRGSILAVAVWHGTYNLAAATGDDAVRASVVTALVIAWAVAIARSAREGPSAGQRVTFGRSTHQSDVRTFPSKAQKGGIRP